MNRNANYAAGFQSFVDGYTSTGGMPHAVYMSDSRRQSWLSGWAAAADCPSATKLRKLSFDDRMAAMNRAGRVVA